MYSPIALFVYNRPAHIRQTVEALQKNTLSKDSDLIIYSDAPKIPAAAAAVREVREYIKTISGFRSVRIVERDKNWGLANSIIDGVTSVVNEHGRIIVLEDDLVTSPYFLKYMNDALDVYEDEEKVMQISGYVFPADVTWLPETFFLRIGSSWGWATWKRSWRHFEKNPKKLLSEYTDQTINYFNLDGAHNFWEQVVQNVRDVINTWAIFWYASMLQKGGLCLHPKYSMVSNIGHDDTGIHCGQSDTFTVQLSSKPITYFERNLVENPLALKRTKAFFNPAKPAFFARVSKMLKNHFHHNKF